VTSSSTTATSATRVASTPAVSRVPEIGTVRPVPHRPTVGRKPTTPQCAAGTRTDPPVSVPRASGTTPVATATAEPPEDPPAERLGSCGLRTGPKTGLLLVIPSASSCRLVLPTTAAPAARRHPTACWSRPGRDARSAGVPPLVGRSEVSRLSFTARGTPASGPLPPAAPSARVVNALRSAVARARSRLSATTSRADEPAMRSRTSSRPVVCREVMSSPLVDPVPAGGHGGGGPTLPRCPGPVSPSGS
jgi:hypothetical protein